MSTVDELGQGTGALSLVQPGSDLKRKEGIHGNPCEWIPSKALLYWNNQWNTYQPILKELAGYCGREKLSMAIIINLLLLLCYITILLLCSKQNMLVLYTSQAANTEKPQGTPCETQGCSQAIPRADPRQ